MPMLYASKCVVCGQTSTPSDVTGSTPPPEWYVVGHPGAVEYVDTKACLLAWASEQPDDPA